MSVDNMVTIIRVTPDKQINRDARDSYIGEIGVVIGIPSSDTVMVKFKDDCRVSFKLSEVM